MAADLLAILVPWHSPPGTASAAASAAALLGSLPRLHDSQHSCTVLCVGVQPGDALLADSSALHAAVPQGLRWELVTCPPPANAHAAASSSSSSSQTAAAHSCALQGKDQNPTANGFVNHAASSCSLVCCSSAQPARPCDGDVPTWLWEQLARAARTRWAPGALALLQPGCAVSPPDWPSLALSQLARQPALHCLLLTDAACPSVPTYPLLRASHFDSFAGALLPPELPSCAAGPFLLELYRAVQGVATAGDVTVHTARSEAAPVLALMRDPPGAPPHAHLQRGLDAWRARLRAALPLPAGAAAWPLLVDVLVPSYRVDPACLDHILCRACSEPGVSLRFHLQLDCTACGAPTLAWLRRTQAALQHRLRVGANPANLGAAGTRNALLDHSTADYVIFWDDDVQPRARCIDAYVRAFRQHPDAAAFAGPSYLPHVPEMLPAAVHMTGVGVNDWEAPARLPVVPWAVTANCAFKRGTQRFGTVFPKTGAGEDVDFCLRLGARMVSVPTADVVHPWWPGGRRHLYLHLFRWALGDVHIIEYHPRYTFRRAPSAIEYCLLLMCGVGCRLVRPSGALAAGAAVLAANAAISVAANCCLPSRRKAHPEIMGWRRPLVALESNLLDDITEVGRLVGHLRRGHWWNVCRRFDGKCGHVAGAVRRAQVAALLRLAAFLAASRAALALITR